MRATCITMAILCGLALPAAASEQDALAISANIQAKHMPFGTVIDPVYASSTSDQIVGYTRCGDSALWTGAYLAAESFRYKVTQSPDALNNVKSALAGLKALADVTGDNRLARCMILASSPFAGGIAGEESNNTIHSNPPWLWVDNTSRDQIVGAFFGLGVAFDLVDDAEVKSGVSDLATRLIGFISRHQWSPNDDISNTFSLRPEELQMLLQVARHVNPSNTVSGPFFVLPVDTAITVDVQDNSSYYKFNLDYMTFYNLLQLQRNFDNAGAYQELRNYTASHQNAFFDMVDRALAGPNAVRDAEALVLLDQWLQRPRRDFPVDLSKTVAVCGSEACQPVPVPLRPNTDFLWQRDPFQLSAGGGGTIETAGIDYILPYWMARYFGVISNTSVRSAAAPSSAVASGSIAAMFGANLASQTATSPVQPYPPTLGGVTLTVTDSAGVSRSAGLIYVSSTQINFVVPDGTAPGTATFTVNNGSSSQSTTEPVAAVAPTLFSMSGTGGGVAAATAVAVQAGNPLLQSPVDVFSCQSGTCVAVPIDVGVDRPVYVTFYGTGIRNLSSLSNVSMTIAGTTVQVTGAGAVPGTAGLDYAQVILPLSLRGSGMANVTITVDGQTSNQVIIDIQ